MPVHARSRTVQQLVPRELLLRDTYPLFFKLFLTVICSVSPQSIISISNGNHNLQSRSDTNLTCRNRGSWILAIDGPEVLSMSFHPLVNLLDIHHKARVPIWSQSCVRYLEVVLEKVRNPNRETRVYLTETVLPVTGHFVS